MKNLWFENSEGKERLIAAVNNWDDIFKCIKQFIDQCNQNKIQQSKEIYGNDYDESKVNLFKRYYTRIWQQEDKRWCIDVGSHTEFFITDVPYEGNEINDNKGGGKNT